MVRRSATLIALVSLIGLGMASHQVQAEGKPKTACEKKADKKKITDAKKRDAYIKKCEKKANKG